MPLSTPPCHVSRPDGKNSEEEAEEWRGKVQAFLNLYGFLSQVIPYQDSDLERLYVFLRHLAAKLPRRKQGPAYRFDDEVRLEFYRLQKISEGSISLRDGEARPLDGPTEVGSGLVRPQPVPLSQLIDIVNERFGTDFNQADQLFFDQIVEAAVARRRPATGRPRSTRATSSSWCSRAFWRICSSSAWTRTRKSSSGS